jgi:multiple sugar transport system substrate-binding protein
MRRRGLRLISLVAVPVLVLSACGGSSNTAKPTGSSAPESVVPTAAQGVEVTWFVGLGSGTQPNQIEAQRTFVTNFNKSQTEIVLKLTIVPNTSAYDVLKTQIAGGKAPDIIGPVGVKGRNGFEGLFLDLTPQIAKNNYDLTKFPAALVSFFNQGGDGQVGLPYLTFPAYMFYNKDLFAKAGLEDLPTEVGGQYMGAAWDWNAVKTAGQKLTLDKNGKNPTQAGFDKNNIVQFGIDFQWWDGRRMASAFGGGNIIADDNKTATISDTFKDAWKWYYDAMWTSSFAPTGKYTSSTLLNNGTTVSSGRIAMDGANGWSINSYGTEGKATFQKWDIAVIPSWKGKTAGPLDADTFTIAKASKNPDQAFKAMVAIMADQALMQVYGGMPADPAVQKAYFDAFDVSLEKVFPGNKVTWAVLGTMLGYPSTPSHEGNLPNFLQASADYSAFYTKLQNTAGLDVDAEMATLQTTLQKDYDNAVITNY